MATIRKRGDTFLVTVSLGYDGNGKQIRKNTTFKPPPNVTANKAKKLAEEFAVKWENSIRGYTSLDENRRFSELSEWYFSQIAPQKLKPNVQIEDENTIKRYVTPFIGNMKLKDISPQVLDSLFSKLLTEGCYLKFYKLKDPNYNFGEMKNYKNAEIKNIYRAKSGHNLTRETAENLTNLLGVKFDDVFVDNTTKKGLAKNTVQNVKMTISAIFTTAVKKEILRRNPVFLTESLAVDNTVRHEDYLTPEQAKKLLEYLENQNDFKYRVLLTFLLLTGCRIGEALGLKWDCIDFETGTIYIRQTLADTRKTGGRFVLQTPKTKNSERYILIPQTLIDLLKTFKEKQILSIHNTVFTNSIGDFYNSHVLNSKFKRTCKLLGFSKNLRIHSIRHSTASLMINADIGVKQIAEQLGHKSTNVTENIYSHIFQSSKIKTMQAIELSLLNDEDKK